MKSLIIILICSYVLFDLASSGEYYFNSSSSMPIGFYKKEYSEVKQGDYVVFSLSKKWLSLAKKRGYIKDRYLIKQVVALENDLVELINNRVFVNGKLEVVIKNVDSKMRELSSDLETTLITKGKALVLGYGKGSFDSRYFGLVDLSEAQKVKAVFTF